MFRWFRKKPSPPSAMHKPDCRCVMCLATQAAPAYRRAEYAAWQSEFDRADSQRRAQMSDAVVWAQQYATANQHPGVAAPFTMMPEPYAAPPALPTADTMGPIRAWRLWNIKGERLWSVSHGVEWRPGVPMAGVPNQHNNAGVYAVKARDHTFAYRGDTILGEVGLWGRVIEHEHGYRAEYAYPIRLVWRAPKTMPGFPRPAGELRRLQALADVYGIPLTVEESP